MNDNPEALRLAELWEKHSHGYALTPEAMTAAELRRLHEQNQRFYAQHASVVSDYEKAVVALKAQRDALLEALHHTAAIAHNGGLQGMNEWQALVAVRKLTLPYFVRSDSIAETHDRVRAAIKAVEEGK